MIRFTNNIDWLESKAREEANSVISVGGLIMHLRDAEKKAASQAVQAVFEEINIHSDVAIYVQIENQVQFAIASGNLKAEDKLPSVRELSQRLNVNPNTVSKAYRNLETMGLVHTRRGLGVFVNKGVENKCRKDWQKDTITRLRNVVAEAKAVGLSSKEIGKVCDKVLASGKNTRSSLCRHG